MWEQLLACLDQKTCAELEARMVPTQFTAGEQIFLEGSPGDHLLVIDAGHVLIERNTLNGDTVAMAVAGPGSFTGEQALIREEYRGASVRALSPVEGRAIYRSTFDQLRREHRDLDRLLIELLDARTRELADLLIEARHIPANERVRRRLVELHSSFGATVPVSQAALATLAGTTRQTVNKTLQDLKARGAIELGRSSIEIRVPNLL